MCCAMTSPQHLVALPSLSSALSPIAPLDTGLCYRQQGALLLCQHRQGPGRERCAAAVAVAVMRPLCPHLQWVPCAPLTFCFSYAAVM